MVIIYSCTMNGSHHFQVDSFGRYQVEGILGRGAMGIVYQGVDPKINRHVAIKTLQLNESANEQEYAEAKTRFFREAQTAGSLSHAHIVTIYDVGEEDELSGDELVLELVTRLALHDVSLGLLVGEGDSREQVGAEVDWIGKAVTDAIGRVDG